MENNNVSSRNDKGEYKIGKNTFKKWDAEIGGEDTALYTTWTMEGNWVTSIRCDAAQGRRTSTLIHGYLSVPLHGLDVPVLQHRQELVPWSGYYEPVSSENLYRIHVALISDAWCATIGNKTYPVGSLIDQRKVCVYEEFSFLQASDDSRTTVLHYIHQDEK